MERLADVRLALRAAAVGVPVFLAACAVPDGGLFRAARYRDVHVYQGYMQQVLHGHVPYRDFFIEYPPGALPVLAVGDVAGSAHYNAAFKALMALLGAATLVLVALLLARLGATVGRLWAGVLLAAVSPALLGPISLNTYDAWPAFLTAAALVALVSGRRRTACALLGAGFAAKIYPAALLPLALVVLWREEGRRRAVHGMLAFVGIAAAFALPFAVLAPHGFAASLRSQAGRGLQVESLGGSLLVAAHHAGLYSATVVRHTRGAISYNLAGSLPDALAVASAVLLVLALAAVTVLVGRGPLAPRRLAWGFAAATGAVLAFTHFFSPQYLVWLVPFVPLLDGLAGLAAAGLFVAAAVLAQTWFFHYRDVFALGGWTWPVLARDLAVVALFAVAVYVLARRKTSTPSRSNTSRHSGLRRSQASSSAVGSGASRSA